MRFIDNRVDVLHVDMDSEMIEYSNHLIIKVTKGLKVKAVYGTKILLTPTMARYKSFEKNKRFEGTRSSTSTP